MQWSWGNFQCRASYNLGDSRARAYCACSRCGWGVVWTFVLSSILSSLSPSLWETARYRLKYCLKGPLNPKQPTSQSTVNVSCYVSQHRLLYFEWGCQSRQSCYALNTLFLQKINSIKSTKNTMLKKIF